MTHHHAARIAGAQGLLRGSSFRALLGIVGPVTPILLAAGVWGAFAEEGVLDPRVIPQIAEPLSLPGVLEGETLRSRVSR